MFANDKFDAIMEMLRRQKYSFLLYAFAVVLLFPAGAQAGSTHNLYIANTNLALELLPAPPSFGSSEEMADAAAFAWTTNSCTEKERAIALHEQKSFSAFDCFREDVGDFFQQENLPRTAVFLAKVLKSTDAITDSVKYHWRRARPSPQLAFAYGELQTNSYPSGHSTRGTVLASVLCDLFPESAASIATKGREIGWHRVLLGMHYPTDVYAGRVLGTQIAKELRKSRDYRRDFKRAKKEVESFLKARSPGTSGRAALLSIVAKPGSSEFANA